jgi:hypothetical protein
MLSPPKSLGTPALVAPSGVAKNKACPAFAYNALSCASWVLCCVWGAASVFGGLRVLCEQLARMNMLVKQMDNTDKRCGIFM